MPSQPGIEQIPAKCSVVGRKGLPWQEVLSPLVEGGVGVGVVEGACKMIKKNNEEKHCF